MPFVLLGSFWTLCELLQFFTPYYKTFALFKIIFTCLSFISIFYVSSKILCHVHKKYVASKEKFIIWYQKRINFDDQLILSLILVYNVFLIFLLSIGIIIKFDGWNHVTPKIFILLTINASLFLIFVNLLPAKILSLSLLKSRIDTENKENFVRYIRLMHKCFRFCLLNRLYSHELRTPLNIADLGLGLLDAKVARHPELKEAAGELVSEIRTSCRRGLSVLDDLLLYEKIGYSGMKVDFKATDLISFINDAAYMFRVQADASGVKFLVLREIDREVFSEYDIMVDRTKMSQAIGNLIYNAINFSPKGSTVTISLDPISFDDQGEGQLSLGVYEDKRPVGVRISVHDTGSGISPSDQTHLFAESVKFSNHAHVGSGLGLWISKKIVILHGGNIGVISDHPNMGAKFFIDLPLYEKSAVHHDSTFSDDSESRAKLRVRRNSLRDILQKAQMRYAMTSRKVVQDPYAFEEQVEINRGTPTVDQFCRTTSFEGTFNLLVVDDSALNRKMMIRVMTGIGHTCVEANDGTTCLETYIEYRKNGIDFDVILME